MIIKGMHLKRLIAMSKEQVVEGGCALEEGMFPIESVYQLEQYEESAEDLLDGEYLLLHRMMVPKMIMHLSQLLLMDQLTPNERTMISTLIQMLAK